MGKKRTQRAIDHWLATGDNAWLMEELPFLRKMWNELAKKEGDYREGWQTYGYVDEEIKCHMDYISDRWFAAFRIKWLIDGLESGKI